MPDDSSHSEQAVRAPLNQEIPDDQEYPVPDTENFQQPGELKGNSTFMTQDDYIPAKPSAG